MFGNLSMTEILFILVIALIIFGPRKLPELGKSLGQSLAQFRRASEDFKRSWEEEVELEKEREAAKRETDGAKEVSQAYSGSEYPEYSAQESTSESALSSTADNQSAATEQPVVDGKVTGRSESSAVQDWL